ncbi:hypothetical protein PIB30_013114 [Stylosanthes scabra]|uniref:Uncharacterized protein n=1 Tax=Stylosanthes scabra TaxID=79078 RepID=A0ABU6V5F5_9FABA|nr:hypothetical protein [Stylosanthes scabra]
MTGKVYEAVKEHFMSLAKEAEMDLSYHMLQKYHHKYFDPETGHPYELSTMKDNDGLEYIIKDKMKKAHYVSSLIIRFDCGVYVLKYLKMVNPTESGKKTFKTPAWSDDELAEFREEIVEYILLHDDNYYRSEVVTASEPKQRQNRPSRALQSPYIQLNSLDLESGNAKKKKRNRK